MFEPRFDRWSPLFHPSMGAPRIVERSWISLSCVARVYIVFEGGLCVLVARRGEVPCTVESFLDGGEGGEGARKRKMRIS